MSRISRGWDALSTRLRQTVETRVRRPRLSRTQREVEAVGPGENIADYWETVETTPIIRTSLLNFAFDVAEPGLRLDADGVVEEYLREHWLPQAAVLNGERHKPFDPLIPMATVQRWGRGGFMLEHVRRDPQDPDSLITGVNPIRPETGVFQTIENKNILVEPGDVDGGRISPERTVSVESARQRTGNLSETEVVMTARDEPAAFIQWHPDAVVTRDDRNYIPLSVNDFTRTVFGGDVHELWGTPVTETVDDDVTGFKNILRAHEEAILRKGWGLWAIGFGRDVLEYEEGGGTTVTEIIEWSEGDQEDWVNEHLDDMGPGDIITHDGAIEMQNLDSEVPDVIDDLEFYVSNITAAMPTPKFVVGFEENVNQFVTEGQTERYELLRNTERQSLATFFTELFEVVIDQNLVKNSHEIDGREFSVDSDFDLDVRIEPSSEESPILSLTESQIEKVAVWMDALSDASGSMEPSMLVDEAVLRELILQLPENSGPDVDDRVLDEDDEDVQAQVEELEEQFEEVMG